MRIRTAKEYRDFELRSGLIFLILAVVGVSWIGEPLLFLPFALPVLICWGMALVWHFEHTRSS